MALSAAALRAKHAASAGHSVGCEVTKKTAVVIAATGGIGEACAQRLAEAGFSIVAVGRDRPGRSESIVAKLNDASLAASITGNNEAAAVRHEFIACDAFSLRDAYDCASRIAKEKGSIDALVMSQGMGAIQGFTPTKEEGNDEKTTLHVWSRAAFCLGLLPALRKSEALPGGPVVMTILSGGIHGVYDGVDKDPELKDTYSIPRVADMAGYYNDLFFDALARKESNQKINFVHAAPGFVNSNWGTEMPAYVKYPIRCLQSLFGKSTSDCAEYMMDPILKSAAFSSETGGSGAAYSGKGALNDLRPASDKKGLCVMTEKAAMGKLTKGHSEESMTKVWTITASVLNRVGIDISKGN